MAVGVLGLSVDDFDRLLPSEFNSILRAWKKEKARGYSEFMAAVRVHAAVCIQPHCKNTIRPADLFSIPEIDNTPVPADGEPLTKKERQKRFEALKKARGYS